MNFIKKLIVMFGVTVFMSSAFAIDLPKVPGLGGGDKKEAAAKEDPDALNNDIIDLMSLALTAFSIFSEALGDKTNAEKAKKAAEGIKTGGIGVPDAIKTAESVGESNSKAAKSMIDEGKKLDQNAGKKAVQGMIPGVKSIAKWPVIKDRVTAYKDQVGVSGMLRAPKAIKGLVKALPKLPKAIKTQVEAVQTATKLLKFSGVETKSLEDSLVIEG